MDMVDLLQDLDALIQRLPGQAFFDPPASKDAVAAAEEAIGRKLPDAYRHFLLVHDGGFIGQDVVSRTDAAAFAAEKWNANHLLGCDDLVRDYADAFLLAKDAEPDLVDWPYVPFCRTNGQEILVFGPPEHDGSQPILDAFHEFMPRQWGAVSKNFETFLRTYIDTGGSPETIALSKE